MSSNWLKLFRQIYPQSVRKPGNYRNRYSNVYPLASTVNVATMSSNAEESGHQDGKILQALYDLVTKEGLYKKAKESVKIVEFRHPHELQSELPLTLKSSGCQSIQEIEDLLQTIVKFSLRTNHPHFYNQLHGGLDEVALTASWLLESLNTNQHTFEVSPVFTVIEKFMIQEIGKLFGWQEADGIFSPGGSISNMYAINCARHKRFPNMKKTGYFGQKQLVMFTSDMSHYSILKGANWLGFGTDQVIEVETDAAGRMKPECLREAAQKVRNEGREPFFVNSTAGSTVFGAHDEFNAIAEVCKEQNLWFHIDACWGGSAILSEKHKHLLKGSDKADSISWNPHKMVCAPLQCSPFIIKDKNLLSDCNRVGATYLFQQDKFYDMSYDLGDKSVQCGRKADSLKLWIMFKIHGMQKLSDRVDSAFEAASYLENQIRIREGFLPVLKERDSPNICFWFVPASLRNKPQDKEWWEKLHKVAPIIKERLTKAGSLLVGYQPIESKNLVNFFRLIVTCYPVSSKQDMDFILDEIERKGIDL